jgi:hypothetical protein
MPPELLVLVVRRCFGIEELESRPGGTDEWVIMHGARHLATTKPAPNLEPFRGWDTQHGVGKHRFHFVENWLAKTDRTVADYAGDGAANAVFGVAEALDDCLHPC